MNMCSNRFVVGDLQGLFQAGLRFLFSSTLCSLYPAWLSPHLPWQHLEQVLLMTPRGSVILTGSECRSLPQCPLVLYTCI